MGSLHGPTATTPAGVEFVSEPVASFARRVRNAEGRHLWLMGGGGVIGSFLDAGAIDQMIVTVVPVLIGEGIPLVAPRHRHVPMQLLASRQFDDGVVQLRYDLSSLLCP